MSQNSYLYCRDETYRLSSLLCPRYKARQSSILHPPSHLPFASSFSFPPPASNRQPSIHRMVSTLHKSRGESIGSFPSTPRTPRRPCGFRTKWRTLSSSARGILCLRPPDHAYQDRWPSNNQVSLHTPARSKSATTQPNPQDTDTMAPRNVVRSRSRQVHTKKVAKYQEREAIRDDEVTTKSTTTTTEISTPESKPSSIATASVNAPLVKERGAPRRRPGSASRRYDDHVAVPRHLNGTQARSEGAKNGIATGDTIDALIDALLQIEDSEECDTASPGTSSSGYSGTESEYVGLEDAIDDESTVCGAGAREDKTKNWNRSAGAWPGEEADARRAWEEMKRRVMHIEEFGALPPDEAGDANAMDHDAERASSEFRARLRRSWAEETIRGHAPEKASRRVTAKKRRRHAGCWVREDGVYLRLVRDFFLLLHVVLLLHSWTQSLFTVRTSNVRPTKQAFGLWALGGRSLEASERLGDRCIAAMPGEERLPVYTANPRRNPEDLARDAIRSTCFFELERLSS